MRTVLIVALIIVLVAATLMFLAPSGPRVTQVTRTRERTDEEDRDDA